jgi:hypothetical protein
MEHITEACWEGYKQEGMKDKNGRMVPNCVPIKEQQINENPAAVAGIQSWGRFVSKMISQGTLTPIQGAVVLVGVPIALYHYIDSGFGAEYVRKIQNFMHDYKEKKNINPEQLDTLIADTSDVIKDMPKGKQQHAARLIQKNKKAMESGDKTAMLSAQRDLKGYVNRELNRRNREMDDLHRATSNRRATAAEKRVAPVGAKHAGFGRWTDALGRTLGYTRDGKWVPSKQKFENIDELHEGEFCKACLKEYILENGKMLEEAEYQGRKVSLGKPMRGDVKKFKVFVKDPKTGNVKKVNFGDKTMRIKKSNPKRRKSFRARHKCDNPGPRTKARYWSCRKW